MDVDDEDRLFHRRVTDLRDRLRRASITENN
jgi:hypothetical protein